MASVTLLDKNKSEENDDDNVVVLNFHENQELIELPQRFQRKDGLKMLLSSGDWVRNHITNIDANPDYDIHVCLPEPASTTQNDNINPLQANINSILDNKKFSKTKLICYVDYFSNHEITEFIRVFNGRISLLGTLDNRILPDDDKIILLLRAGGIIDWKIAVKLNPNTLSQYFRKFHSSNQGHTKYYIKLNSEEPKIQIQSLNKKQSTQSTLNKLLKQKTNNSSNNFNRNSENISSNKNKSSKRTRKFDKNKKIT
jgi:hypothetical protein